MVSSYQAPPTPTAPQGTAEGKGKVLNPTIERLVAEDDIEVTFPQECGAPRTPHNSLHLLGQSLPDSSSGLLPPFPFLGPAPTLLGRCPQVDPGV